MNFQESAEYLLSLGNEVSTMKLGLENIRKLLAALGDRQNNYLKVQVAGTNGKGSVCAFLNSICLEAGIRVGKYTSPHLVSITERVQINGVDISENDFAKYATQVRETSERLVKSGKLESVPTFFEQVTAIALIAFADAGVELAILETGLGGKLDATTAANAQIAAITRIDLDHQQYLGETLAEIAAEKAAIVHPGSRVVIGEQADEAMKVILDRCLETGVEPLITSEVSIDTGRNPTGREGVGIGNVESGPLGLAGRHQSENAKIAILLSELLNDHLPITYENVIAGLAAARHPGRLELHGRYLFDGAHNSGGARALRNYLDEFIHEPITMIFGSMNDKDVKEIASILFPKADRLILTKVDNARALTPEELRKDVPQKMDGSHLFLTENVGDALAKARDISKEEGIILVTGSLYLVGEARRLIAVAITDN